ncbi:unnamed protein product [Candida verbasci]|uniref:Uncharacterized protein n=1 Tax=Candida verbasci TaxID=1227364 RepID=A0A9W4X8Q6_9ASCO|nr:unnamed protein product [Candida verbasci]
MEKFNSTPQHVQIKNQNYYHDVPNQIKQEENNQHQYNTRINFQNFHQQFANQPTTKYENNLFNFQSGQNQNFNPRNTDQNHTQYNNQYFQPNDVQNYRNENINSQFVNQQANLRGGHPTNNLQHANLQGGYPRNLQLFLINHDIEADNWASLDEDRERRGLSPLTPEQRQELGFPPIDEHQSSERPRQFISSRITNPNHERVKEEISDVESSDDEFDYLRSPAHQLSSFLFKIKKKEASRYKNFIKFKCDKRFENKFEVYRNIYC